MSYESWAAIYYPVDAAEVTEPKAALDHSLTKWEGLRPKVLAEHNLERQGDFLVEKDGGKRCLEIDATSCALCGLYLTSDEPEYLSYDARLTLCSSCPLYKVRGMRCDRGTSRKPAPYQRLATEGPGPMINWLRKAKQQYPDG